MRYALLFVALMIASLARADDLADLARAQSAYDRGIQLKAEGKSDDARAAFSESASLYRDLVGRGADNFGVHFNAGNAAVQAGDLGHGIASYLRAEQLAPHDSALKANLTTARSDVRTKIGGAADDGVAAAVTPAVNWWRFFSERSRAITALVAWTLFWLLVAPTIAGRRLPTGLRTVRTAALVIAVLAGASVGIDRALERARPVGVIVADAVVLRKGNGDGFAAQVEESLGSGVEFRLLERRPQWLRVRLADGTEGWIKESQADLV